MFVLIACQVEDYRNISKLSCIPLAFTSYNFFQKNAERPHFLHNFWRKIFLSRVHVSLSDCPHFMRCIVIVCWTDCDVIDFEINLVLILSNKMKVQTITDKMSNKQRISYFRTIHAVRKTVTENAENGLSKTPNNII